MITERGRQARWLLLLAACAIALYLTYQILQPFLSVLVWAGVLVLLFFPVHRRLARWLRRPSLAALCSVLLVILVVLIPVGFVGAAVGAELAHFAQTAQERVGPLLADPLAGGRVQEALDWFAQKTGLEIEVAPEKVADLVGRLSQTALKGTFNVLGGVFGATMKLALVVFTLFYLFRDAEEIRTGLPDQLPLPRADAERIVARTGEIIQASVNGNLVIAVVQGVLGGLAFAVLGLPGAILWGAVMAILSMLPLVGASLVWGPVALWLLLTGSWGKGLGLALWGGLVIGSIDNLLRPRLVGERARMHELTIFFAVLGGLQLFGVLGFLVGPVVVVIARSLFEIVLRGGDEPPAGEAPAA